jgi:DNA-binding CsgD family transcriptional regulator
MADSKPLSRREWEVAELLLQGKSNKLIALSLGISERTVEFHLKNIYAKSEVSSRIELVLKLGKFPGAAKISKPVDSTVENPAGNAENRHRPSPQKGRVAFPRDSVSFTEQELNMKNLLSTLHVPAGAITALLTGFAWIALLKRFGHMSNSSIAPWIVPLALALTLLGGSVGWEARRNGHSTIKAAFCTLAGTGVGAFSAIPLIGFVAYPLAKLGEALGLINRAAVSTNVTSALVILAMIAAWLIVGVVIGTLLLFLSMKRSGRTVVRRPAPERGL